MLTFDRRAIARSNQLAAGLVAELTVENVLFALPPRAVIAAIQTTTIRASITAYSTAVGPSSFFRNETMFLTSFIEVSQLVSESSVSR